MENTKHFNYLAKYSGGYNKPLRHIPKELIPADNQARYKLSQRLKAEYNRQEIIRNERWDRMRTSRLKDSAVYTWFKIKNEREDVARRKKIKEHEDYIDNLIKKYKPRRTSSVRNKELTGTLMECLAAVARRNGWKQTHRSQSSIYLGHENDYVHENDYEYERLRISDHYLPSHPEREYNHSQGWKCADREIIVTDQKMEELIENLNNG